MKVLIFDTETSGLISNRSLRLNQQPSVIDFYGAVVDLATGEIGGEFETLLRPPSAISEDITRITGLRNEDLETASPFSAHAETIKRLVEGSEAIIAHNLSFDREMLDIEFERLGQTLQWPAINICTVEATVHLTGLRLTLSALHYLLFGTSFSGAHRARHDVAALIRCAIELHKRGEI